MEHSHGHRECNYTRLGYHTLFIEMWYDKQTVRVANTDYVREVTKWPGHTRVVNIPVEYK